MRCVFSLAEFGVAIAVSYAQCHLLVLTFSPYPFGPLLGQWKAFSAILAPHPTFVFTGRSSTLAGRNSLEMQPSARSGSEVYISDTWINHLPYFFYSMFHVFCMHPFVIICTKRQCLETRRCIIAMLLSRKRLAAARLYKDDSVLLVSWL